ncbi:MAG: hypothetical protein JWN99_1239, partial [Ilumatobacteraceae bacterium]|nr:hypothetical protein [Ilumatobacteraceae bacterium]
MSQSRVLNARPDATSIGRPRIAILGTVELITGAHTTSLPGTNLPTLLSLLAMSPGRPVSNGQLLAALWPDVDPVKASRSLISLVHQLNTALATHLGIAKAV